MNWCNNKIVIEGPSEKLALFIETLEDGNFCFNQIVPCPEELYDIYKGSCMIENEYVDLWHEIEIDGKIIKSKVNEDELKTKYGFSYLNDWCIANWGVNFDIDDCKLMVLDGMVYGFFDASSKPPIIWLKKASEKFPELKFSLAYIEECCDIGFYGVAEAHGGLVNEQTHDCQQFYEEEEEEEENEQLKLKPEIIEFVEKHGLNRIN
jgi:hypothetical protein